MAELEPGDTGTGAGGHNSAFGGSALMRWMETNACQQVSVQGIRQAMGKTSTREFCQAG